MVNKLDRGMPLAERAYQVIKQLIITNELPPEQSVTATGLAETLEISRSPLKAALARLEEERFLQNEPRRGLRVAPLDQKYVREVYELRTLLECECARLSATRIEANETRQLAASFDAVENALRRGDPTAFDPLEAELHRLFVNHCGNDMLRTMMSRLQDHWNRIQSALSDAMAGHKLDQLAECREMLQAIEARDASHLQQTLKIHLTSIASEFLESLADRKLQGQSEGLKGTG